MSACLPKVCFVSVLSPSLRSNRWYKLPINASRPLVGHASKEDIRDGDEKESSKPPGYSPSAPVSVPLQEQESVFTLLAISPSPLTPFFPQLTFRSLATSTSVTLRLCVFLCRTRTSACTGGALVAAAACAVDFVFGAGLFAGAVESGLFAAGAGGFFCADAAAGAAAAGYGDG
jgi:hypothetical protein